MHATRSASRLCHGMSWQHLHPPVFQPAWLREMVAPRHTHLCPAAPQRRSPPRLSRQPRLAPEEDRGAGGPPPPGLLPPSARRPGSPGSAAPVRGGSGLPALRSCSRLLLAFGGVPAACPGFGERRSASGGGLEGCESDAGPQAKQRGMAAHGQTAITLYSVSNYNFGTKEAKVEKDVSVQDRLLRMQSK